MRNDASVWDADNAEWDEDDATMWRTVPQRSGAGRGGARRARTTWRGRRLFAVIASMTVGMFLPLMYVGVSTATAANPAACSKVVTAGGVALDSLCVMSSTNGSTTPPYGFGIKAGDPITDYKWLISVDTAGDPSFVAAQVAACMPTKAQPTGAELATNPTLAIYASAGTGNFADCQWPSMHESSGGSPVVADGDGVAAAKASLPHLPNGKYLLSLTAPNYKIDGIHFSVAGAAKQQDGSFAGGYVASVNDTANAPFTATMNPLPKKTATLRVHVFNDNASTNGQWDGQTETLITCDNPDLTPQQQANCGNSTDPNAVADPNTDMSGFTIQITDVLNPVTTDVYGNPLCTQYATTNVGTRRNPINLPIINGDGSPIPVFFNGGASGGTLHGTESTCISDHYGDIVIPNLGPNRYAATVIPPDPTTHDGEQWVQTTTLEGGHDWDSWVNEGMSGFDTELIVGGERVPPIAHGFVKLSHNDTVWKAAEAAGRNSDAEKAYYNATSGFVNVGAVAGGEGDAENAGGGGNGVTQGYGHLVGAIHIGRAYIASGGGQALAGTNLANAKDDGPIEDGLISISCTATCQAPTDQTVWVGRARADGTFDVNHLQTGDYTVAFWDEKQDYILAVLSYHVEGDRVSNGTRALPTVTSVATSGGGFGGRNVTLTFASAPGLAVGDQITLSGGGRNGWRGTYTLTAVSGNTVTFRYTGFGNPPTSSPTAVQQVYKDPAPTDVKNILLPGWFTDIQGSVFNDLNGNGKRDECDPATTNCAADIAKGYAKNGEGIWQEPGIPDFTLTERTRGNSLQDQGAAVAKTNDEGQYDLSESYPLGQFLVLEAYNQRFKNTGYTYQADNDPSKHTVITSQVDYNFLPVIGISARIDIGVQAYDGGENGGIVGTVTYDTTRNEFDPAYSVQEDYQAGISGIPMQLWKPHFDANGKPLKDADGAIQQWGITADGAECVRTPDQRGTDAVASMQTCLPYAYYVTETWQRPTGCQALDINGNPLTGEKVLPQGDGSFNSHSPDDATTAAQSAPCIEAPMNGLQIGGNGTVDGNFTLNSLIHPAAIKAATNPAELEAAYADGNSSDPITNGNYLVEAINPQDTVSRGTTTDPTVGGDASGGHAVPKRLYRFTDETAVNIMSGDSYVPQEGYTNIGGDATASGDYSLQNCGSNADTHSNCDPNSNGTKRYEPNSLGQGTVAKCAGALHLVDDAGAGANADFGANGGSPFQGQNTPICDSKLVKVIGGRSVNPGFFMYSDVPIPTKFYGLVNDDLNVQTDRRSILLGEVAPLSNAPVGIYDENGNWKYTAHSDVNGFYEVILPSTDTYNCPLPAGPCPNVYRLIGNDPGTLGHRNADYNPQFRTIGTEFQGWPGVVHPVDQAPTHQGITIEGPAAQFGAASLCKAYDTSTKQGNPVLFQIDRPFYDPATANDTNGALNANHTYTVNGVGFGTPTLTLYPLNNAGAVTIDANKKPTGGIVVPTDSASDSTLTFHLNGRNLNPGPYQLMITNSVTGQQTVNGLTFHVLSPAGNGATYLQRTDVYEVVGSVWNGSTFVANSTANDAASARQFNPGNDAWDTVTDTPGGYSGTSRTGARVSGGRAIQRAIEAAHGAEYGAGGRGGRGDGKVKLVVVYPNESDNYAPHNAFAAYFENIVIHGKVKVQGVGPGSSNYTQNTVDGTVIDASTFWAATQAQPVGTNVQDADGTYSDDWRTFANGLLNPQVTVTTELPEGEGVLAIAETSSQYASSVPFKSGVDGVLIMGGDQQGNPTNVNTIPGSNTDTAPGATPPGPAQGGAIMLDQHVQDFAISNNLIQANGGTYGTIRIGTPDLPSFRNTPSSNFNTNLNITYNRIIANGGTALAGALGLFQGSDNYYVAYNDFCGNFSAEYGGAISHYGQSPGGRIFKNRIYYNQGYDEGGGIIVAGELPANNSVASNGAGRGTSSSAAVSGVTIDSNVILANLSNDDGGGLRFLMPENYPMLVENNIIANNVSTHEGGGIALDDAPQVTLVNNTVVKNITTATAATNGAFLTGPSAGVKPANPAGLSTGGNSTPLMNILCRNASNCSSPNWSKPTMLNNIFADNRAGWALDPSTVAQNQSVLLAIGSPGDATAIQRWDVGIAGGGTTLNNGTGTFAAPFSWGGSHDLTNTRASGALQKVVGTPTAYVGDTNLDPSTDGTATVGFKNVNDFTVDSLGWRVNNQTAFPVIVAQMVPVGLLADYHLATVGSPAFGTGVAGANVPGYDIDSQLRPTTPSRGADEIPGKTVNISMTKTDGVSSVLQGGGTTYTITVTNSGPDALTGGALTDPGIAGLTISSWTCNGTAGSATCGSAGSSGALSTTVNIPVGGTVTASVVAAVSPTATGNLVNTASLAMPIGTANTGVSSATDTDSVTVPPPPKPTLTVLDNFNRANANTLNNGSNWTQASIAGFAGVVVNTNRARGTLGGTAVWNGGVSGTKVAAAFTVVSTSGNPGMLLKTTNATIPLSWERVRVTGAGQITVDSLGGTGNSAQFNGLTISANSVVTAQANADGSVDVWLTTGATTTYVGHAQGLGTFATGYIGITLSAGGQLDDFAGASL